MPRTSITTEQCAALLVEWLRRHCNSEQFKATAKAIGYRYSIFSPQRKLHLLEEIAFLYIGLAVRATNAAIGDYATSEAVVEEFLAQLRGGILGRMSKDDTEFASRYARRMGAYFEQLRTGADPLWVAGDFLVFVFGTPDAGLKLKPALHMVATVSAALQSLQQLLAEFDVSDVEAL